MPKLEISAPDAEFNEAVAALCHYGQYYPGAGTSPQDFAVAMIRRWFAERIIDHKKHLISEQSDKLQRSALEAVSQMGSVVEIVVTGVEAVPSIAPVVEPEPAIEPEPVVEPEPLIEPESSPVTGA